MDSDHRAGGPGRWLMWLGRVIGLAASAFFLTFFIGEGVPEIIDEGVPDELVLFIPLLLVATGDAWSRCSEREPAGSCRSSVVASWASIT